MDYLSSAHKKTCSRDALARSRLAACPKPEHQTSGYAARFYFVRLTVCSTAFAAESFEVKDLKLLAVVSQLRSLQRPYTVAMTHLRVLARGQ